MHIFPSWLMRFWHACFDYRLQWSSLWVVISTLAYETNCSCWLERLSVTYCTHIIQTKLMLKNQIYPPKSKFTATRGPTHTGCPRRNVPDFVRVFLVLRYTDITQNTYIQSWTVMEIMAWEKWGLLAVPNTATCTADALRDSVDDLESGMQC